MAKRTEVTGAGMTAHEVTLYSGEHLAEGLRNFLKRSSDLWSRAGGGPYEARTLETIESCRLILENASDPPYEADSPEDFATRILDHHKAVIGYIEQGAASTAARYAFNAGVLLGKAEMKEIWQTRVDAALASARGSKVAGSARKRRMWAVLLAEHISSWDDIPEESFRPLKVTEGGVEYDFYRDIDKKGRECVRCVDADLSIEVGTLVRVSFEKRYLKK